MQSCLYWHCQLNSTTKPGTLLKHQIPFRMFARWDDHRPGFLEADLVAYCGGNVFGGYLSTLTLTDIATGWTECVPVLNRSPETVFAAIGYACMQLPFPILGLDTDNGGAFLDTTLLSYCQQEQITFTRSRPDCSNDIGWSVCSRTSNWANFIRQHGSW